MNSEARLNATALFRGFRVVRAFRGRLRSPEIGLAHSVAR
jgi:hypothetical protein